jgi:hypothetical protein
MRRVFAGLGFFGLLLVMVPAGPPAQAQPTETPGGAPIPRALTRLPELPIERSLLPEAVDAVSRELGVSAQVARKRLAVQHHALDVIAEAERHRGSYAGAWFDDSQGVGVLNVAFTHDGEGLADHIAAAGRFPDRELIRVHQVERSAEDLDEIVRTIEGDRVELIELGASGLAVDAQSNTVRIDFALDDAQLAAMETAMQARYGADRVTVGPGGHLEPANHVPLQRNCLNNSRDTCNPLRGGATLHVRDRPSNYCTMGFNAYRGGTRYILTAGHCLDPGYGGGSRRTMPVTSWDWLRITPGTAIRAGAPSP